MSYERVSPEPEQLLVSQLRALYSELTSGRDYLQLGAGGLVSLAHAMQDRDAFLTLYMNPVAETSTTYAQRRLTTSV